MAHIHVPRPWSRRTGALPPVLDESAWLRRRELVKALGLGGLAAAGIPLLGCSAAADEQGERESGGREGGAARASAQYGRGRWRPDYEAAGGDALYPAPRAQAYGAGLVLNPEGDAATKNNFYEFLPGRAGEVYRHVGRFEPRPWRVEVAGAVEEERSVDIDEIARIAPLEERVYRFRCVERWSMVVPWTGIPMKAFVAWCRPKPAAKYLRFVSFLRPDQAPGQKSAAHYPWPYYEGLRMDEATNELAMIVTGIFGHALPVQHGAPIRVIVPWKYGYKSAKSFVRVEFTERQPPTFWNDFAPKEYGFLSNVEPDVPHPRWSQAQEVDITTGERRPTLPYNGYGAQVGGLYAG